MRRWGLAIVHGRSMEPTLAEGDRLLVHHGATPKPGGLVVVRLPGGVLAVKRAREAFLGASDERLAEVTRVNTFDLTGISAAVRCVAHFRGHTQEIIHMTREMLGDQYQFAGPR